MPIRINLLAEDLAAEEMRRKDPVKFSIWIGCFLVSLVLLWGLSIFLKSFLVRMELKTLETRWSSMEKAVRQVEADRARLREAEQKLSALTQFTTNRFLWANVLDAFQHVWVDNLELTRFRAEQTFLQNVPAKPAGDAAAAAAALKASTAVEKITLHLDGKDYSAHTAEQIARFRESMSVAPFFQASLQKTNSILLTSLSAPQAESRGDSKKSSFVMFGLQLNFQEKERRLYE